MNYSELSVLLSLVKDNIVELHLRRARESLMILEEGQQQCHPLLGPAQMPNLRTLTVPYHAQWASTLDLLNASPNLENQIIRPGGRKPNQTVPDCLPCLPNLRMLKVENAIKESITLIPHLIDTSPRLGRAVLWANFGQQTQPWWREIIDALRRHESLRSLDTFERIPLELERGGFESLRELDIRREYDDFWTLLLDASPDDSANREG